ncbi:MAG: CotS family spore coat protein [Bacillota bacterium]|jgi:CotS family spore coat protein
MKEQTAEHWNIDVGDVRTIQDNVFFLKSSGGGYILKRSELSEEKLRFVCEAERLLTETGFSRFALPVPTAQNEPFARWDGGRYTLHRYIDGIACDFDVAEHLAAAADTLADLHTRAKLRPLAGSGSRGGAHCRKNRFESKTAELKRFSEHAAANTKTEFTEVFLRHAPAMIRRAERAEQALRRCGYGRLAEEAARNGRLIHYDVAARNFLIRNGEACLIDFDYCRVDLPEADLARLLRRALKNGKKPEEKLTRACEAYQHARPLSKAEKKALLALILFPQKFWRCSHRFFRGENADPKALLKTLHEAVAETERENQWLGELREILEVSD